MKASIKGICPHCGQPMPEAKPGVKCPHRAIQDLFNRICVSLPRIMSIKGYRLVVLEARWKEMPDLEWWDRFFVTVEASDWLTGRKNTWRANFDWVIKASRFNAICEGNYVNVTPSAPGSKRIEADKAACMEFIANPSGLPRLKRLEEK